MTLPLNILLFLFSLLTDPVTVDPRIKKELNAHQRADVLCILRTGIPDLAAITRSFDLKAQKGNYVLKYLLAESKSKQAAILDYLDKNKLEYHSYYIVNAIHLPGADAKLIRYLSAQPEVLRIEYNEPFSLIRPESTPLDLIPLESRAPNATEWGISRIRADTLWQLGIKGKGAVVGSGDTGVELHPAIKNSYRGSLENQTLDHNYNWHDAIHSINPLNRDSFSTPNVNPCGLNVSVPCDDHNHGTHTVGTMAATDLQTGVAPEAKWIGCRCMERGWGSLVTYLECFQWFLAPTDLNNANPDPAKAPHVINNSWGCVPEEGCNSSNFGTMEQVVKNLKAAGIFVTVSAGNDGSQGCGSINDPPAILEPSFSVGATAINDTIAGFSSRGPVTIDLSGRLKPNISAPGVGVRSTIRNGGFATWNGTSMASPHVSGAVALLISAFPSLAGKVELLEDILEKSADPKTIRLVCGKDSSNTVPNNIYGYGRLNVYKAYLYAKQLMTTPVPGSSQITLKVFPNPFYQQVVFDFGAITTLKKLTVFDAYGREVYNLSGSISTAIQIETAGWTPGIYFYQVYTREGLRQGKMILAK